MRMRRHVLWSMLVMCASLALGLSFAAEEGTTTVPPPTTRELAEKIKTTPTMCMDETAETASFSQVLWPDDDESAGLVRQNPLIGQVTVSAADYKAGKTRQLLEEAGVFTSGQVDEMLAESSGKWKRAELSLGAGEFLFIMTQTRQVATEGAETRTVTEHAGLGAGSIGQMVALLGKLSGPDTPLSLSTVVADDEVITTLGLSAWLSRREETKTFTLKPDFQEQYPASWRFSVYGGDDGGVLVEVLCDLTKEQTAKAFDVKIKRTGQPWGFTAGYDIGGGDRPFYLGTTWSPAGRFGLTAGYVLGGGESGDFAFGVSFDVGDLIDDVTTAVGGGEEQGGEETGTGG